jgi:hypothetical protein
MYDDTYGENILFPAVVIGSIAASWTVLIWILCRFGRLASEFRVKTRIALYGESLAASLVCLFLNVQPFRGRILYSRGYSWGRYYHFVLDAPWAFAAPVLAYVALRLAFGPGHRKLIGILMLVATVVLIVSLANLVDVLNNL